VATVAIDGAKNAGILAAQILSTASDEAAAEIREKLVAYKKDMRDGVKKKNDRLQEIGYEEYIKEK
jgi:5-(carboxyamino)imidazole ribonucleotide mutase